MVDNSYAPALLSELIWLAVTATSMMMMASPKRACLVLVSTLAICSVGYAQDHCWIKYSYDAAGNRIKREWWCGDPNAEEENDGPRTMAATDFGLRVMPNPANEKVVLTSEQELLNAQVEILTNDGKSVLRTTATGVLMEFDVSGLAPGLYTLRLRTEQTEFVTRFAISH